MRFLKDGWYITSNYYLQNKNYNGTWISNAKKYSTVKAVVISCDIDIDRCSLTMDCAT